MLDACGGSLDKVLSDSCGSSGSVLRDCCRMLLACGGSSGSILMDCYRMIVACGGLLVMLDC